MFSSFNRHFNFFFFITSTVYSCPRYVSKLPQTFKKLPRRNTFQYSTRAAIFIQYFIIYNILIQYFIIHDIFSNNYKCYFQLDLLLFTYISLYSRQPEISSNSLPLCYSRNLQARSPLVLQDSPACLTAPVLCSMFPHCRLSLYGNGTLR